MLTSSLMRVIKILAPSYSYVEEPKPFLVREFIEKLTPQEDKKKKKKKGWVGWEHSKHTIKDEER